MVSPTDDTAATMDKLGISLTNQKGKMKSLMTVMEDLRSGFIGLTAEEQALYAESIAGATGLSGLLAIINASSEDFASLTSAIYGANDTAAEMADISMDTLQGDFAALNSAVDDVKISIGGV